MVEYESYKNIYKTYDFISEVHHVLYFKKCLPTFKITA